MKLGLRLKGDVLGDGDKTALLVWWPIWGDPASAIDGMQNLLAWVPRFGSSDRGDLEELAGIS